MQARGGGVLRALTAMFVVGALVGAGAGPAGAGATPDDPVSLVVQLELELAPVGGLDPAAARAQAARLDRLADAVLADLPGPVEARRFEHVAAFSLAATPAQQAALAADPRVAGMRPVGLSRASTTVDETPVGTATARSGEWDGRGRTVVVLDTGVDLDHPAIAPALVGGACFARGVNGAEPGGACPNGQDAQADGRAVAGAACVGVDGCFHGTHVASIAAGRVPSGVAPGASLYPVQVFNTFTGADCSALGLPSPCQLSYDLDQLAALEHVIDQVSRGVLDVAAVNMSTNNGFDYTGSCDAAYPEFATAVAHLASLGVAVVASTGNREFINRTEFPACLDGVVAVAATGADGQVLASSNVGRATDLLAPGQDITGAVPNGAPGSLTTSEHSGSSMAAPMVAGALAVLAQAAPQRSLAERVALLRDTGPLVQDLRRGGTPANRQRVPRVDLAAALAAVVVPEAPAVTTRTIGDDQVAVAWTPAPVRAPGRPVVDYVVTEEGAGTAPVVVPADAGGTTVGGLVPGTHRFSVVARNAAGAGRPSVPSAVFVAGPTQVLPGEVENPTPGSARFVPFGPQRALDTRTAGAPLGPDGEVDVPVADVLGVPAGSISAVALTVTLVDAAGPGYVTAWPAPRPGELRPATSSLNAERAGQTIANLVVVPVGADGRVRLYTQTGGHLLADLAGWWTPASTATAGRFSALDPARLLDTRLDGGAPLPADGQVDVAVLGQGGVPASGVAAVAVTVTATDATAPGYVTVWPSGQPRPLTSVLNVERAGQTIPDLVVVPVGADGRISLYAMAGGHLIVDVAGWFSDAAAAPSRSGLLVPVAPTRLVDTRDARPVPRLGDSAVAQASLTGPGPVPAGGRASGVVGNLTGTGAAGAGYVTVWAGDGAERPTASNLNVERPGQTIANGFVSPLGGGAVQLYSQSGIDLVLDVTGWFTS